MPFPSTAGADSACAARNGGLRVGGGGIPGNFGGGYGMADSYGVNMGGMGGGNIMGMLGGGGGG